MPSKRWTNNSLLCFAYWIAELIFLHMRNHLSLSSESDDGPLMGIQVFRKWTGKFKRGISAWIIEWNVRWSWLFNWNFNRLRWRDERQNLVDTVLWLINPLLIENTLVKVIAFCDINTLEDSYWAHVVLANKFKISKPQAD